MHSLLSFLAVGAAVPFTSGILSLAFFGKRRPTGAVPSLVFHAISSGPMRIGFSHFPAGRFAQFLDCLNKRQYAPRLVSQSDPEAIPPRSCMLTFDDGFESFFHHAFPELEKHSYKATIFPVAGLIGKRSLWDVFPSQNHLNAAQLRAIAEAGHEIGSHGMTHADLRLLGDKDLRHELSDSKKMLEDFTGTAVRSISFPFGSWDDRVWHLARECGYTHATSYRPGAAARGKVIPVAGVYAFDTVDDLFAKLGAGPSVFNAHARANIMPHFAKGSSLWKFRPDYRLPRGG